MIRLTGDGLLQDLVPAESRPTLLIAIDPAIYVNPLKSPRSCHFEARQLAALREAVDRLLIDVEVFSDLTDRQSGLGGGSHGGVPWEISPFESRVTPFYQGARRTLVT